MPSRPGVGTLRQLRVLIVRVRLQIVESATVEDGVVRLRSADGWISYLHAITVSRHDIEHRWESSGLHSCCSRNRYAIPRDETSHLSSHLCLLISGMLIAGIIWVGFFSRCQRYRCGQGDPMLISAAEAGDDAEVRADPCPCSNTIRIVSCLLLRGASGSCRHRMTCHDKHTQA